MSRWMRGDLPLRAGRVPRSAALAPLAAVVLLGLAVPQLSGQVLQPGSFSRVPGYWYQAAAFLAAHSPEQTALANRVAQVIHRLPPETVAALHAVLDTTTTQPKPSSSPRRRAW